MCTVALLLLGMEQHRTAEAAIVASLESPPFDEGGSVVDIIEN